MKHTDAILRPRANGQITIPAAIRRALGITDSSFLQIHLEDDRIVISRLRRQPDGVWRLCPDELSGVLAGEAHPDQPVPLQANRRAAGRR